MPVHKNAGDHASSSNDSGGRKPHDRPVIGKTLSLPTYQDPGRWPIYVIGNVTFQWNHAPKSKEDEDDTVATLAAYMENPNDEPGIPASFRNYQPVWGVVKYVWLKHAEADSPNYSTARLMVGSFLRYGPHTTTGTSNRDGRINHIADQELHVTVKFSTQKDRDNCFGYTVHIYNSSDRKYDSSKHCTWRGGPDTYTEQKVYDNRARFPATKTYKSPSSTSSTTYYQQISTPTPSNTSGYMAGQFSGYSIGSVSYSQSIVGPIRPQAVYSAGPVSYSGSAGQGSPSNSSSSVSGQYSQNTQQTTQSSSSSLAASAAHSQSSTFVPGYVLDESLELYYCLLSNGTKVYWNGQRHYYIDPSNQWVEYTGALNA